MGPSACASSAEQCPQSARQRASGPWRRTSAQPPLPASGGTLRASSTIIWTGFGRRWSSWRPQLSPEELNRRGFALYEAFRPAIPAGARGWGAAGELDLERIIGLTHREPREVLEAS